MLIGIDMLGVQSPGGVGRESGRYGRELAAALMAGDPVNRYVLYTHEGLPTDRVPSARNALRVSLTPVSGRGNPRRAATQRLLDLDPDGLDWLVLLDPFDAGYGGLPPEAPLHGPRVASVVHDLDPALDDDRRLVPIRRHDAVLAPTEATAVDCRRRLGLSAGRVAKIGLACDPRFASPGPGDPLTRASGDELGRLGILGPFLLASIAGGPKRDDLSTILGAYQRLPIERRRGHQLVVAGAVEDPAAVRSFLRDRGSEEGLVLAGEVPESSLGTLYGRCSAFLAPAAQGGSGLSIVEAMRSGAPVIAGRSPARAEIVGDAGRLVAPSDPAVLASAIEELLSDADLQREFRRRSLSRSARFSFAPVVEAVVETLGRSACSTRSRWRVDRGHSIRPRIAVFPALTPETTSRVDLASQVPAPWRASYAVDLYVEPGDSALVDGVPPEFGGFDARLFDRNDAILGYHAVVYRIGDAAALDAMLIRLRKRPGLVFLMDDAWLDRVGSGAPEGGLDASAGLLEVFQTGSRVVVQSPRHFDQITASLPEFAGQLVEIPPASPSGTQTDSLRAKARVRLDLLPGSLVIGQFGRSIGLAGSLLTPRGFKAIARAVPEVVLLSFDAGGDSSMARREAAALGIGDRFVHVGPMTPSDARDVIAVLDLAIHQGESDSPSILDLLKAGVPTIALGPGLPDAVVRNVAPSRDGGGLARAVRDLASDPEARSALGRSALAYCVGTPDPARASMLLLDQVERCAAEIPRATGRHRRPAEGSRGLVFSPHFPRPASATGETASRSR